MTPSTATSRVALSSGMLSTITKPGNLVTTLTRDFTGTLQRVTNTDGSLLTMAYDSVHRMTSEQLGQITTTFAYDSYSVLTASIEQNTLSILPLYITRWARGMRFSR